jgi:hypothetical protein
MQECVSNLYSNVQYVHLTAPFPIQIPVLLKKIIHVVTYWCNLASETNIGVQVQAICGAITVGENKLLHEIFV